MSSEHVEWKERGDLGVGFWGVGWCSVGRERMVGVLGRTGERGVIGVFWVLVDVLGFWLVFGGLGVFGVSGGGRRGGGSELLVVFFWCGWVGCFFLVLVGWLVFGGGGSLVRVVFFSGRRGVLLFWEGRRVWF